MEKRYEGNFIFLTADKFWYEFEGGGDATIYDVFDINKYYKKFSGLYFKDSYAPIFVETKEIETNVIFVKTNFQKRKKILIQYSSGSTHFYIHIHTIIIYSHGVIEFSSMGMTGVDYYLYGTPNTTTCPVKKFWNAQFKIFPSTFKQIKFNSEPIKDFYELREKCGDRKIIFVEIDGVLEIFSGVFGIPVKKPVFAETDEIADKFTITGSKILIKKEQFEKKLDRYKIKIKNLPKHQIQYAIPFFRGRYRVDICLVDCSYNEREKLFVCKDEMLNNFIKLQIK